jgi:hypothetical protein
MLRLAGVAMKNEVLVTAAEDVAIVAKLKTKGRTKTVKAGTSIKKYALPLEAGMLDLRNALKGKKTLASRFKTYIDFVRRYWKFFTVAAAVVIFIVLVWLFVKGAMVPHRNFEVKVVEQRPSSQSTTPVTTATSTGAATTTETSVKEQSSASSTATSTVPVSE